MLVEIRHECTAPMCAYHHIDPTAAYSVVTCSGDPETGLIVLCLERAPEESPDSVQKLSVTLQVLGHLTRALAQRLARCV